MADDVPSSTVGRYLDHAVVGDHLGAAAVASELLAGGCGVPEVLDGLLGAAQRETGFRWHRNQWTVVDEHIATTTTHAVLESVLALALVPAPEATEGLLTVVCAEGDWHSLPARLFSEGMRRRGWSVSFLGASLPADHVAEFLDRIPVLIGGPAVGQHRDRALAAGADVWALKAADADAELRWFRPELVRREPVRFDQRTLRLDAEAEDFADAAMAGLGRVFPALRSYDQRKLHRTHEDLAFVVRFAAVSLLMGDERIWDDFVSWQLALLAARAVPAGAFHAGVDALATQLVGPHPEAGRLLAGHASSERT